MFEMGVYVGKNSTSGTFRLIPQYLYLVNGINDVARPLNTSGQYPARHFMVFRCKYSAMMFPLKCCGFIL
jgi:hypothetical protein